VVTRGAQACDRFLLTTPAGRLPTEEQRQALERALEEHQQERVLTA